MAISIPVIITAFRPILSDSQPKNTKKGVPKTKLLPLNNPPG
jgi:hypothetical protein